MENDTTASWMVFLTFFALAAAIAFALFHLLELKDQVL